MIKEDDRDFDLISSYFNLELTNEEMISFEKRLKSDPDFQQKVGLYKESMNIVEETYNEKDGEIRHQHWRALIEKSNDSKKRKKLYWWINISAAAAVSFLIIYYLIPETPNYEEMTNKAWSKNVGLDFIIRNDNDDKRLLINALRAYENKGYDKSLQILKVYDSLSDNYKDVLLLRALSLHKSGQTTNALATLDTLQKSYPSIVQWYKGLIHLDIKNLEEAKKYIVIPTNTEYQIRLKE